MLSRFFIDRPIFAGVISVAIFLAGLIAMTRLPISEYPEVVPPSVQVTAQFPGANPITVADTVATPLEEQFGEIPGLTQMTSSSALGYTQVTLQFDLSRAIDGAVSDTLSAINAANAAAGSAMNLKVADPKTGGSPQ